MIPISSNQVNNEVLMIHSISAYVFKLTEIQTFEIWVKCTPWMHSDTVSCRSRYSVPLQDATKRKSGIGDSNLHQ